VLTTLFKTNYLRNKGNPKEAYAAMGKIATSVLLKLFINEKASTLTTPF